MPDNTPELTTSRLHLRPISAADFETLFWLRSDERVNQFIDRQPPENLADVASWFEKIKEKAAADGLFYWAICMKGEGASLVGTACLFNFSTENSTVEIGYELHPDFQKKGLANEALQAVIRFCFDKLPFETIEADIHKNNAASIKLIEKHGFKPAPSNADENENGFVIFHLKRPAANQ